jgi:ABC-2 type transport system ATP-binding protein
MSEKIIETHNLTVYYGKHRGIQDVNLTVERGEAFGFLGPNGAGKTTTQRVLLDVIRPTVRQRPFLGWTAANRGLNCAGASAICRANWPCTVKCGPTSFSRCMNICAATMAPTATGVHWPNGWTWTPAAKSVTFHAATNKKWALWPPLWASRTCLILDEPTSGLDPLVQQTVMEMVREVKADGRTVFFSSHILPEVQAVCDRVGIIREGQLVATQRVEELIAARLNRMTLIFADLPPAATFTLDGVTEISRTEQSVTLEVRENLATVLAAAAQYDVRDIETHNMSLEEIFLDYYGQGNGGQHD